MQAASYVYFHPSKSVFWILMGDFPARNGYYTVNSPIKMKHLFSDG